MENSKLLAWQILTKKEKQALQLVFGHSKTHLEAAVIMNIYPYKFKEIILRAKKFFRMFSDYFEYNEEVLPQDPLIESKFRTYIDYTVQKRIPVRVALGLINDHELSFHTFRRNLILDSLHYLKNSGFQDTFELLMEFDQWNGHRILPKAIQRNSPFPRRQNRVYKRFYNQIINLSELGYLGLEKLFKTKLPPLVYIPLIAEYHKGKALLFKAPKSVKNLEYFGENLLPCFESKQLADKLLNLVLDYYVLDSSSSLHARKFWPQFRDLVNQADNYNQLLNIKDFSSTEEDFKFTKDIGSLHQLKPI